MANPHFMAEKPLSLADLQELLQQIEKRDQQLNFLSMKAREYLTAFVQTSPQRRQALARKLAELQLTRLKEEHIAKIVDFLPSTAQELKVVLQSYPLTLPKKDQESIVQTVVDTVKE